MAFSGKSQQQIHLFVQGALLKKGTSPQYDELKSVLRLYRKQIEAEPDSEVAVANLAALVAAIGANVSAIKERRHQALVSDILSIKLWTAQHAVRESVLTFAANLMVANSAFTHTCLQLMVYSFTPPPAPPNPDAAEDDNPWRPTEQALAVHTVLLGALQKVLGLVPIAPTNMLPLVVQQMPHKLRDRNTQCLYLDALFNIAEARAGAPIREALLTAALEHLLTLDVEIKWEDITDVPTGEEEEGDEALEEDVFELEGLASELDINAGPEEAARHRELMELRAARAEGRGWEGQQGHAAQAQEDGGGLGPSSSRPPVDEMANKLDSMMELTFGHLARRIDAGDLARVWDTLLGAFERTILNTQRSKFTQFLVFYVCSRGPELCPPSLISLLLDRLRDSRQPSITRASCAAYLASFLARAAFLPPSLIVATLRDLTIFCHQYVSSLGSAGGLTRVASAGAHMVADPIGIGAAQQEHPAAQSSSALVQRHQVLFATVQAALYVLCYHLGPIVGPHYGRQGQHRQQQAEAAEAGPGSKELADAVVAAMRGPLWQVLNHKLQPLAVCLPTVVKEFTQQAMALGIFDCRPLLPKDDEQRAQRPLEMFFPFDPYLLRRSSRYLQLKRSYVQWRHGHPATPSTSDLVAGDGDAGRGADGEGGDEDLDDLHGDDGASSADDDDELSSSSSAGDDEEQSEEEDGGDSQAGGHSLPSDAILHDPKRRMTHFQPLHGRRNGQSASSSSARPGHASQAVMGTSYMSYMSNETTSVGGMSPYGTSPIDGVNMLERNPLGASPGAIPMSLGTPDVQGYYMTQVPRRIGRR